MVQHMIRYLVPIVFFLSCAGIPPGRPQSNDCGLVIVEESNRGGLTMDVVSQRLGAFFDVMTLTTDYRLSEPIDVCQRMVGFRIYTRAEAGWVDPWGRTHADGRPIIVAGLTSCKNRTIEIGRPESGNWSMSSLVHELFHLGQECEALMPATGGMDDDHANWSRDGINDAIERAYSL